MKKSLLFAFLLLTVGIVFAQEVQPEEKKVFLDGVINIWTVLAVLLGGAAMFLGKYLLVFKTKLKETIALLSEFSKAIEDNKISKAEKEALIEKWKALISKK